MAKKKAAEKNSDGGQGHATKKKGKEIDSVRVFAEKMRDHKELESRWAVLHEARVEYFRGKDFVTVLRTHPELLKHLGTEVATEDAEMEMGNLLLKRKLIVRCDRVVKTLRPGKKKLSKWPARIELFTDQSFSEDDAFFAWTFERRRPLWQTVLSFLVPIVTLACCLFPVFPPWCKLGVLYFCLAFLSLIFGVLILRAAIFGFLWLLLGKRVWFFPNILAEEATLTELFQFWPDTSKDDDPPPKWSTRLAFAVLTGIIVWVVVHHGPNEAARARYQKKVSNIIDEVLVWKPKALAAFTGQTEDAPTAVLNETVADETSPKDAGIQVGENLQQGGETHGSWESQASAEDPLSMSKDDSQEPEDNIMGRDSAPSSEEPLSDIGNTHEPHQELK